MSVDYCVYSDAPPTDLYALTRQILEVRPEYLETHIFHHEDGHRCRFVDGSPTTPQLVSEEYQLSFVPRSRLFFTMIDNVDEQAVDRKSYDCLGPQSRTSPSEKDEFLRGARAVRCYSASDAAWSHEERTLRGGTALLVS